MHVAGANTSLTATNAALEQTIATSQKATESLTTVQQAETKSTELLATSTKSNADILAFETQINELVSGFTTLRGDLESNKIKQAELFAEFEAHRNKIKILLGDANRTGMAASFTNRRRCTDRPPYLAGMVLS